MGACTYCGPDLSASDPVCLCECEPNSTIGRFCNVACLVGYVDEESRTEGDACQ